MNILRVLPIIKQEVALFRLIASELAHDIVSLTLALGFVLGYQKVGSFIERPFLSEEDTHTLLCTFFQIEMKLWVQHSEP